jgi:hypothetical protein
MLVAEKFGSSGRIRTHHLSVNRGSWHRRHRILVREIRTLDPRRNHRVIPVAHNTRRKDGYGDGPKIHNAGNPFEPVTGFMLLLSTESAALQGEGEKVDRLGRRRGVLGECDRWCARRERGAFPKYWPF